MDSIEFGKTCQPYNIAYRDLFGAVPCPDDYACDRDTFFAALKQSVETKTRIEKMLPIRAQSTDTTRIY